MYILGHIISIIIVFLIGWAIWKLYIDPMKGQRYFYVSYYTTKKFGNECKIIYGSNTFITYNGQYLNKNEITKLLEKDADTTDSVIVLSITELKRKDYIRFTN